jgi:Kef-type K+ transport system membrane component KefB/voltage-gated potassium channel Kch
VGNIFFEITIIIVLASLMSLLFRLLKQPEILAYILTGILIGPIGLFHLTNIDLFKGMAEVGITLLLFMIGLEIKVTDLNSAKTSLIVGPSQIFLSFIVAYLITLAFGFPIIYGLYISLALTFSSTIVVIKLLSDRKELHSLYAKMAIGILLIQDFVAIMVLILLSSLNLTTGLTGFLTQFTVILVKAGVIFAIVIYLSQKVFPKIFDYLAKSEELLFLISLAWVFGFAALISSPYIGFSIEIGGFLAGLSLANSMANYQIIAKAKILRDFFIVIFFVLLGLQMTISNFSVIIIPAIVMSLFVLLLKPLITMLVMGDLGYKKRTSFLTGLALSQVSEFSLIVVFLGNKLGQIPGEVVSLVTLVCIITFALSTYLFAHSKKIYVLLSSALKFLEDKEGKKEQIVEGNGFEDLKNHIVLVGGDQMGLTILEALEGADAEIVVIDFDPNVVKNMEDKKVHRLFGDIADLDIQQRAKLETAKLVISTVPDMEDNLLLIKELNHENRKAKIVVCAMERHEARALYKAGADYVVLPHLAGGRQIAKILDEDNLGKIATLKEKDIKYLN